MLDGKLNEEIWQQAPAVVDFLQRDPDEGAAPTHRTEARIAYDEGALYVAVRAFDSEPDKIVGILTRRDQRSPSDWIRIVVDSYFDRRSAYEFGVNPVGVKTDRYYFNDGQSDDSWDAVWDVEVEKDAEGWRAEFRIPFSQLRFNNTSGGPVGFSIIREVGRLAETSTWPLLSRNANGFVSQFGELRGLKMSGAPKRFELMPYSLGKVDTRQVDASDPLTHSPDPGGSLGLDLKYAVTPGLTLTATANPDFGQVEADPAVVNLDAFETFFPERRPFFVEGSGTFRFNMDCNDGNCTGMFYSRRIGRAPQGYADRRGRRVFEAARLGDDHRRGQADRPRRGILDRRADGGDRARRRGDRRRRRGRLSHPDRRAADRLHGDPRAQGVPEPVVARLHDDVDEPPARSGRQLPRRQRVCRRPRLRLAPVADVQHHRLLSRARHIAGNTEAIQRLQENNVHALPAPRRRLPRRRSRLRRRCSGHAGSVSFGKISGESTRFSSYVGYKSPGFDTNDLGFMRRADEKNQSNWFQWRNFKPGKYVRTRNFNINQYAGWNFGGDRLYSGGNINSHWTFTNYYSIGGGYQPRCRAVPRSRDARRPRRARQPEQVQPLVLREHRQPQGAVVLLQRRPLGRHQEQRAPRHQSRRELARDLVDVAQPRPALLHQPRRLAVGDERGSRDRRPALRVRPHRSEDGVVHDALQLHDDADPVAAGVRRAVRVSAGEYSNYKELVDGRAEKYEDRYQPYAYGGSADFNIRSFRTTNVLRWEYRPGSQLFLVWQQGKSDDQDYGDFRFGRDFGGVFSAPSRNVFLIKFSYWLNM